MTRTAYEDVASVYDSFYSFKDYGKESRIVLDWIRRTARIPVRTLLDVGCGTGGHLEQFARTLECTGLDRSPQMLREARRRLPFVKFMEGRMESFDLGREFDAVTCLFSAIGYVRTRAGLRSALRTFARHLRPGGVLVLEPWLTPEGYIPGGVHLLIHDGPKLKIARMNLSQRRRNLSIMEMHYLVATPRGVRYFRELHEMGLFDVPFVLATLNESGIRARFLSKGIFRGRGLFVGVRLPSSSFVPVHPIRPRRQRSSKARRSSTVDADG